MEELIDRLIGLRNELDSLRVRLGDRPWSPRVLAVKVISLREIMDLTSHELTDVITHLERHKEEE